MNGTAIDHVKLDIPADGIDDAVAFYRDALGFGIDGMDLYESGEKPFFSVRLAPGAVIHLEPDDSFERPADDAESAAADDSESGSRAETAGYDHVAVRVDDDIDGIERDLAAAGVEIDRRLEPLGATGVAPAVYVTDPFGYRIELKAERS